MTISPKDLEKMAGLACLVHDTEQAPQLTQDINAIMDFVDQLRTLDTSQITPLFHPFANYQRLRNDEVTESNNVSELEAMATLFEDALYLVPKVIEQSTK